VRKWPLTITKEADFKNFCRVLMEEDGVNFHPDDPGESYYKIGTDERTFSDAEARWYDRLINQAFEMFGDRVYDIALDEFQAWQERGRVCTS
jgi:hypothetical protein